MINAQPILFALNIATLCIILFSTHLLLLRTQNRQVHGLLSLCLLSIGTVICLPTMQHLLPQFQVTSLLLALPALLLISPSLWLYTKGLTSQTPWQLKQSEFTHFLPALFGCTIALSAFFLPTHYINAILVTEQLDVIEQAPKLIRYSIYCLLILTFISVLGWVLQSAFYIIKIIERLRTYRGQLQDVFASTEQKELRWLSWLLLCVGGAWLFTAVNLVLDNVFAPIHFDDRIYPLMQLVVVYSLALWGLRQKPGFAELYTPTTACCNPESLNDPEGNQADDEQKYRRSALSTEQAIRIGQKIEQAMQVDKLYLDAALSLPKLAKHIHTSPNYISQTLNETLGVRFFDYVNKYRIDEATNYLQSTDRTVLDIAMAVGFNSKSAFYTAFKKHTSLTPNQYKKTAKR
ncbi:AraC family transcriptional regulator [Pseudoalteromonas sp. SMS1]|uniref:helix-turn-helix domain-containing protein n=1 Tax=Pseudoalteromonas sp. SMS1 TaxID=2908894 RepID=UPI001F427809|nr:AraC family transcriptional regulator [Pseudoalteromonas sp. SMS1]MCF2858517.1 AraC family transcriptional regulator [Pseudoalteromonas sp. SMS1]